MRARLPRFALDLPGAEVGDGGGEGAGEVLDAEGVGVAGGLEGGALVGAGAGAGGDFALAEVGMERAEDLGEVGVGAGDGGPGERAGEVAVLAVGGAALGEVELPVGGGRDGLEFALAGRVRRRRRGWFWRGRRILRSSRMPVASATDRLVRRLERSSVMSAPRAAARSAMARPCGQRRASGVMRTRRGFQSFPGLSGLGSGRPSAALARSAS